MCVHRGRDYFNAYYHNKLHKETPPYQSMLNNLNRLIRINNRLGQKNHYTNIISRAMASYLKPKLKSMSYDDKEKFVKETIQSHAKGVLVFSKTYWPYASKGKKVVAKTGCKHTIIELDDCGEPRNGDIQKILAKITNIRTVPQIFIAGRSVGGGDDIERLHNKKKLIPMMKKAGIECKDK